MLDITIMTRLKFWMIVKNISSTAKPRKDDYEISRSLLCAGDFINFNVPAN